MRSTVRCECGRYLRVDETGYWCVCQPLHPDYAPTVNLEEAKLKQVNWALEKIAEASSLPVKPVRRIPIE